MSCFQIVSLPSSLTTMSVNPVMRWSCELLSNCIFTEFSDNAARTMPRPFRVVSCFQIVSLPSSLTTVFVADVDHVKLWVAFKLYLYRVLWQLVAIAYNGRHSCELLSNCIFTEFSDNYLLHRVTQLIVVSCFQIVSLPSSLTTDHNICPMETELWVAFKLYLYRVLWQRSRYPGSGTICCELLSNCIFTEFSDNPNSIALILSQVVSCFQIVSLPSSLTT